MINGDVMNYLDELKQYQPYNDQEKADKESILQYIELFGDYILSRDNQLAHFSASSMILNEDHTKVLMIYHNIYQSWSWTGGHADEEKEMLKVALKEAKEETGLNELRLLKEGLWGIEILPVGGHIKNGRYVGTHMHLNYSYLFEADENQVLKIKEDENSGVMWIGLNQLAQYVNEKEMLPIYQKLLREY